MCNGSVECAKGNDETHAFCPNRLKREALCEPSCVRGTCVDGTCDCPDSYFGETCQSSELSIESYYRIVSPKVIIFHFCEMQITTEKALLES